MPGPHAFENLGIILTPPNLTTNKFLNPKKKDLFDVNPPKKLSAELDSPWSTEGPNFMSNKSLGAIC